MRQATDGLFRVTLGYDLKKSVIEGWGKGHPRERSQLVHTSSEVGKGWRCLGGPKRGWGVEWRPEEEGGSKAGG